MEKTFVCPVCGKKVTSIAALNECVSGHVEEEQAASFDEKKLEMQELIDEKYTELFDLIKDYNDTYGGGYELTFRFHDSMIANDDKAAVSEEDEPSEGLEDFLKSFTKRYKAETKSDRAAKSKKSEVLAAFEDLIKPEEDNDEDLTKLYETTVKEIKGADLSDEECNQLLRLMKAMKSVDELLR